MRTVILAYAAVALLASLGPSMAQDGARPAPTKAERAHARKMVRAMDDYDAQIARRQKQLMKEQRQLERMSRGR